MFQDVFPHSVDSDLRGDISFNVEYKLMDSSLLMVFSSLQRISNFIQVERILEIFLFILLCLVTFVIISSLQNYIIITMKLRLNEKVFLMGKCCNDNEHKNQIMNYCYLRMREMAETRSFFISKFHSSTSMCYI